MSLQSTSKLIHVASYVNCKRIYTYLYVSGMECFTLEIEYNQIIDVTKHHAIATVE